MSKPLFEPLKDFLARVKRNEGRAAVLAKELQALPLHPHPQQCAEVAELVSTWMEDASEDVQGKAARAIIATLLLVKDADASKHASKARGACRDSTAQGGPEGA